MHCTERIADVILAKLCTTLSDLATGFASQVQSSYQEEAGTGALTWWAATFP